MHPEVPETGSVRMILNPGKKGTKKEICLFFFCRLNFLLNILRINSDALIIKSFVCSEPTYDGFHIEIYICFTKSTFCFF